MPALSACHAASGRHHRNPPYFLVDDCVGIAVAFVMRIMNLARRALMLASVMIALTNFIPKLRVTVPRHVEAPTELVQNISHEHFLFVGSNSSFLSSCPTQWPILGPWTNNDTASFLIRSTLPFTVEAQETISQSQNPHDCKSASFLLYTAVPSGFGSVLHVETAALAGAIMSRRILAETPNHWMARNRHCGNATTLDSCYFLPLSNCTLLVAGISQAEINAAPEMHGSPEDIKRLLSQDPSLPRVVKGSFHLAAALRPLVAGFESRLMAIGIPPSAQEWWWRAQASMYIVRPNTRTVTELERRKSKIRGADLRPGCISLYVRHGDKGRESRVFDDAAYEDAVFRLRTMDKRLTRQIFLSTEDPATVRYFTNATRGWATTYVDMKRK